MKEEWKAVIGFEECYCISNFGRIKSLERKIIRKNGAGLHIKGKILKTNKNFSRYSTVGIGGKICYVHRILAKSFIPNPYKKKQINHKDGNKSNNNINNLEWATPSENTKHAWDNGQFKSQMKTLTEKRIKRVLQFDKKNKFIKEYSSIKEASIQSKVCRSSISMCSNGYRKTAGGYIWRNK